MQEFGSIPGVGVHATIAGVRVMVGAPARLLADLTGPTAAVVSALEETGRTVVLVRRDGVPVGLLGIADRLRADAAATVATLGAMTGATPLLLTGENPRAATAPAAEIGIDDVRAGCCPKTNSTRYGHCKPQASGLR